MLNFITRYFTSLWAFITSPFRAIWRLISRLFPPRQFTVMDTPNGNVYSYEQSSFWRFTRFCGKVGLFLWATWSTYVFVYHRPLLQKRTEQLQETRELHTRHMSDLKTYLAKYNDLTRNLNVLDDKILNSKELSDKEKESLMNSRVKTWGELDFLRTRIVEMLGNEDFEPEFTKLSELSAEYELTRAENEELKRRNATLIESMTEIANADNIITDRIAALTKENTDELQQNIKQILNLQHLYVQDCNLQSLDVTKNLALKSLSCTNNELTTLDVSNNIALEKFYCNKNKLPKINVTANKQDK